VTAREYRDDEAGLVVQTGTTRRTTHTVDADFNAHKTGANAYLSGLRLIVGAAQELPDESEVSVFIDGKWRTPDRVRIEYSVDDTALVPHGCGPDCHPGNCEAARVDLAPWPSDRAASPTPGATS
jgi:hypothetical protein